MHIQARPAQERGRPGGEHGRVVVNEVATFGPRGPMRPMPRSGEC